MPVCFHGREKKKKLLYGGSNETRACHFNLCGALSKPLPYWEEGVYVWYAGQRNAIFYHKKHVLP